MKRSAHFATIIIFAFFCALVTTSTSCSNWQVKFQESTGVTPGQAVGIISKTATAYEQAKAANTHAKNPVDVEPDGTQPEDAGGDGGSWLGLVKLLWGWM